MKYKLSIWIRAILQVLSVVILHLLVIHFMDFKLAKWEEETIRRMFVVYSVLIVLLYVTCVISLLRKRVKYSLMWFFVSTVPSIVMLHYLENNKESNSAVPGITEFKFDDGIIEFMFVFPCLYFLIQLILIIALWILKYPKNY